MVSIGWVESSHKLNKFKQLTEGLGQPRWGYFVMPRIGNIPWRIWLWVPKRLDDYCMIWELGMWVSPGVLATATLTWPHWLVRRSAWGWCYLQQPSTISHSEPQSLLVFMIWFWPTISSCQRSAQLTPGTLVASHPSSFWIKMVLPPSWDRHLRIIIEELLGCSLTREPGTILCKLCWSPRYPGCIQSQQLCLRSNFYGFACSLCQNIRGTSGVTWTPFFHWFGWGPCTQDQALPRRLTMKIFSE